MADIALSALQTLFAALESRDVQELMSIWGYQSELEDLQDTVSIINDVLLDAEAMEAQLSTEQRRYIQKLKHAIHDADDLLDEVLTLAHLKKHHQGDTTFLNKVRFFFSSNNPIRVACTTHLEVKKITKKLDAIATKHTKFGFKLDNHMPHYRMGNDDVRLLMGLGREETCSFVNAHDIIGRDFDLKVVVDMLLDYSSFDESVGFVTIVGMGGLGKTTFAKLVYHVKRFEIEGMFELKLWVCVSDKDGKPFEVKTILGKILKLVGGYLPDDRSSLETVQNLFQEKLGGKRCLLVLDDVWMEEGDKWGVLRGVLMAVLGVGSRILATSRSYETARIIGNGSHEHTYELKGLSELDSWQLFKLAAFGKADEQRVCPQVLEIGKKIVKRCCNVPLAIKVLGSLLFGREKGEWRAFEKNGLEKIIRQGDNKINSILKLSYDHLTPSLKACFSYCALFRKDYEIEKEMLISLWLAQGYIKPRYEGQTLGDAGNEHFSLLLRRCFFQDMRTDAHGNVKSCKLHDLMHDVALEVARKELNVANSVNYTSSSDDRQMHWLFIGQSRYTINNLGNNKVRTCLKADPCIFFENFNSRNRLYLRALSLFYSPYRGYSKALPESLGKLLHLRYLKLEGFRELRRLPNSITELYNLQTLILDSCFELEELPKDLSKLVNLRHLDIMGCRCGRLSYMPEGMYKLTCLEVLTDFYVTDSRNKSSAGQLRDLKALHNLSGDIVIHFPKCIDITDEEGILEGLNHVKNLNISYVISSYY